MIGTSDDLKVTNFNRAVCGPYNSERGTATKMDLAFTELNTSQWTITIDKIYGTKNLDWIIANPNASFFVKSLANMQNFYNNSVRIDGATGAVRWRWTPNGIFTCASAYKI